MKALFPDDPLKTARLLQASEELAEKLGIRIVTERMRTLGGLCRIKGEWRLYLRPDLDAEEALDLFARAFAQFDLTDQYVLPALREEIERRPPPPTRERETGL